MTKEQDLAIQRVRSAFVDDSGIIEALKTTPRTVTLSGRTLDAKPELDTTAEGGIDALPGSNPPDTRGSVIDILSGKRKTR
jgi:hypothetical protein